ncbi:MAG: hypothetical protein JWQ81_5835 [Amycolatopsis sp.]|nr:hypothetical protein [Amycolatopsis sp.]
MFWSFLLTMGFLVLLTFGLADHADSGWWAAWGGWIGGLGSTAAAVTAVWVAVEGWRRSDRLAREQAARLDDQESRELASKFGVWIDKQTVELDTVAKNFVGVETSPEEYRVMYSNSGSQPVYRVVLVIRFFAARKDFESKFTDTEPQLGPTTGARVFGKYPGAFNGALRTLMTAEAKRTGESQDHKERSYIHLAEIELNFTDGNGKRWTRLPGGELVPADPR